MIPLLLTLITALLVAPASLSAEVAGLPAYLVAESSPETEALADAGVEAVALPPDALSDDEIARIHKAGLRCLRAIRLGEALNAPASIDVAGAPQADGLLVVSLPEGDTEGRPAWDVECGDAAEGSLEHLLAVKESGDPVHALFRELAEATDLPVYLAMPRDDAHPATAVWRYIDLHLLLAEGLVDGVFLAAGDGLDLRRPRLHTDREILAGIACPGEPSAAAMTILRSRDADAVLAAPPGDPMAWLDGLRTTLEGLRRAQEARERLAGAVESGELTIAAGVQPEGDMDVATIHGVAQSFRFDEPTTVVGVGLMCILRGPGALGQDDLTLTIRPDAGGEPDPDQVLVEARIPAAAYAEPGWEWGYAQIDPPLKLDAGQTCWLHGADTTDGGNSFVWRITRDGTAYPDGNAWSHRYDYEQYDWAFRILAPGGDTP